MLTNKQKWRRIKSKKYQKNDKSNFINQIDDSNNFSRVSFSNKNSLILIPTRQDYKNYGLHNELWWQPTDYLHFKSEAKEEVTILMKLNNMDVKSAIHHLYQPHNNDNHNPQNNNHQNHNNNHNQEQNNHQLQSNHASSRPSFYININENIDHIHDALASPSAITRSPSPDINTKLQLYHHCIQHNDSNNINFLRIHPKNLEQSVSSKLVHPLALMAS